MSEASRVLKVFRLGLIKKLIDYFILKYLKERGKVSGYELISQINQDYGVLLSSGTIYGKLYALERKGLIKGEWGERKREFTLTKKGERTIDAILKDPTAAKFLKMLEKPKEEQTRLAQ